MDVSQLEPADCDPAKLRRTALIVTVVMIASSFLILFAYNRYVERTGDSDRPPFKAAVTDNNEVKMLTATGVRHDLQELKGKVVLSFAVTKEIYPESLPTIEAVKKVLADSPEEKRPHLLVFVLDGDEAKPEDSAGVLGEMGDGKGIWRVPASEDYKDSLRAFMKNRMRFGIYPHDKAGKLVYDTQLLLLDQHLQIRGPKNVPIGWDFGKVAQMEAQFEAAKKTHEEDKLNPPPITSGELSDLLKKSINYLYDNPEEKGQK